MDNTPGFGSAMVLKHLYELSVAISVLGKEHIPPHRWVQVPFQHLLAVKTWVDHVTPRHHDLFLSKSGCLYLPDGVWRSWRGKESPPPAFYPEEDPQEHRPSLLWLPCPSHSVKPQIPAEGHSWVQCLWNWEDIYATHSHSGKLRKCRWHAFVPWGTWSFGQCGT